jgi:hypothetical protein
LYGRWKSQQVNKSPKATPVRKSVLVMAPQAALHAAAVRFLMQAGDTVGVASNAKRVHKLLEQRTFDAAIVSELRGVEGQRT